MFVGSGGEYIDELVGDAQQLRGYFRRGDEADMSPAQYAINAAAQLLATDEYNRTDKRFGYAYEVLLWSDEHERFDYVDDVFYTTLVGRFDDAGAFLGFEQIEPVYYYRSMSSEFCEVFVMWHRSRRAARNLIGGPAALHKEARRLDLQRQAQDRLRNPSSKLFDPSLYCCTYHSVGPKFVSPPVSMVLASDSEDGRAMFNMAPDGQLTITPRDYMFHVLGDAWLGIHGGIDAEFPPGVRDPRVWRGIP